MSASALVLVVWLVDLLSATLAREVMQSPLSACLFRLYLLNRMTFTLTFYVWVGHDHGLQMIEGEGVRLMWLDRPRLWAVCFLAVWLIGWMIEQLIGLNDWLKLLYCCWWWDAIANNIVTVVADAGDIVHSSHIITHLGDNAHSSRCRTSCHRR